MRYKIFENGIEINTIVADEAFVKSYCEKHGYTYEKDILPEVEPIYTPTNEERITILEEQITQADETAIELYEMQMVQEEINTAQDDALIELYEMIGG